MELFLRYLKPDQEYMGKRILLHIGFWLLYWLLNGYVEVFLSNSSFVDLPFWQRLWKGFGTRLTILPLEMSFAYYSMYVILPRYFQGRSYWKLMLEFATVFTVVFALYRLLIPYVIYPYIYLLPYPANTFDVWLPRYIYTAIRFVSVTGMALTIKLLRIRFQQLEKEKLLTEEKLQNELRFLRAQTNPHFLFNTLNNVYALARKKSDQTAPVIMKLSKLLRFMLYECNQERITVEQEVQVIEDYLELEKLRYNNRLEISFEKEVDDPSTLIAPLLILPLIENAFKHGASETRFETFVRIKLRIANQQLQMLVENSKDEEQHDSMEGIGLPSVNRQLALLYPNGYQLDIQRDKEIFAVDLSINLNSYAGTHQVFDRGR